MLLTRCFVRSSSLGTRAGWRSWITRKDGRAAEASLGLNGEVSKPPSTEYGEEWVGSLRRCSAVSASTRLGQLPVPACGVHGGTRSVKSTKEGVVEEDGLSCLSLQASALRQLARH